VDYLNANRCGIAFSANEVVREIPKLNYTILASGDKYRILLPLLPLFIQRLIIFLFASALDCGAY
jgi:hypothetical protein